MADDHSEVAFEDKEARRFLKKMIQKTKDVKDKSASYAKLLSAVVFQDVIHHFDKQQGSSGAWKKWSRMYREHMSTLGKGSNRILQDTGRLRMAFMPTNVRSTSEGILWFNPAKTKTGFPYAAAHNEGGDQLPKRDFMWLSDNAKEGIEEQTLQFIEEGL
jgi:phage gpG-like protein